APVINELMLALWKHLRPLPYQQNHSHATMRILGKLGGRNRRMLKDPPRLTYTSPSESGVDIKIYFDPITTPQVLPLDHCLALAARISQDPAADDFSKEHAYKLLKACTPVLINTQIGSENLAELIAQ